MTGSWSRRPSSTGGTSIRARSWCSIIRRAIIAPGRRAKRGTALPGQTVYSAAGRVYVDGRRRAESYLPADDPLGPPIASGQHPFRVPPGEVYLLGDNRATSCDSRYWGPIAGSSIVGHVVLLWWRDGHPVFHWF